MDDVFSVQVALREDKVGCTMMMQSHTSQMSTTGSCFHHFRLQAMEAKRRGRRGLEANGR